MKNLDFSLLDQLNFTQYEKKALITLLIVGVADAATLCKEGDIPSSKIYLAMEKLAKLGLIYLQPTRPKLFAALSVDDTTKRLVEIVQARAQQFAEQATLLKQQLHKLSGKVRGREAFVDLALGSESHVKRHLTYLATAKKQIFSYLESNDLDSINQSENKGFTLLRRVTRNALENNINHKVVFGFSYQSAPILIEFLARHRNNLKHITGIRYSGELSHPFHVIDKEIVILALDHPYIPGGRYASLLFRDLELAHYLQNGFERLWNKAMHNIQEINYYPGSNS